MSRESNLAELGKYVSAIVEFIEHKADEAEEPKNVCEIDHDDWMALITAGVIYAVECDENDRAIAEYLKTGKE